MRFQPGFDWNSTPKSNTKQRNRFRYYPMWLSIRYRNIFAHFLLWQNHHTNNRKWRVFFFLVFPSVWQFSLWVFILLGCQQFLFVCNKFSYNHSHWMDGLVPLFACVGDFWMPQSSFASYSFIFDALPQFLCVFVCLLLFHSEQKYRSPVFFGVCVCFTLSLLLLLYLKKQTECARPTIGLDLVSFCIWTIGGTANTQKFVFYFSLSSNTCTQTHSFKWDERQRERKRERKKQTDRQTDRQWL